MKINARIAALAAALSLYGAATAGAQQDEHKPGGLNKVAHDISKTSKKAGQDTKAPDGTPGTTPGPVAPAKDGSSQTGWLFGPSNPAPPK